MAPTSRPAPRDAVRAVMTKWGDRPHWEFDGVFLGSDVHGDWLGFPAGTLNARPGAQFVSEVDAVTLVPAADGSAAGHLSTFHRPGIWCEVYVDITTPADWDGTVVRAVDLDLDVIRGSTGRVWVDDEDEFAAHRVAYGYPEEVVAAALETCQRVHSRVAGRAAPYDGSHARWLAELAALGGR